MRTRQKTFASTSAALDAFGDPNRRAIIELLAAAPSSVQSIADRLPISRPAVSRHLRLLKEAHLVSDEADGARRVYRLEAAGVDELRRYFEDLWAEATRRFQIVAENTTPSDLSRLRQSR